MAPKMGRVSYNATLSTEESQAYPIFLGAQPTQYGEYSCTHEAKLIQGIVYDETSNVTSRVVDALRKETFRREEGDTLRFDAVGAVRYTHSQNPAFNLFSETEDEEA